MVSHFPFPPNPATPLALLPPELAYQFEISRYVFAVTLGICICDVFSNLQSDFKLLFEYSIRFPVVIYFSSRVTTLALVIANFVFQVAHVPHCQALLLAIGVCYVGSVSATSLLFCLRVRAMFFGDKVIRLFFGVFWFTVTAASVAVPAAIYGAHIGPTTQCINVRVKSYSLWAVIPSLAFDSAVFLATSYRVLSHDMVEDSICARFRVFFGVSRSIPRLFRILLHSGQYYYLVAVCGNIVIMVMLEIKSFSDVYHGMTTVPALAITNIMACIVFRKLMFGDITDDASIDKTTQPLTFRIPPGLDGSLPTIFSLTDYRANGG